MFYKCIVCQKEHEPPRLPASNVMTHCPDCGQPVTLIVHDTEPPPPDSDTLQACRGCGGAYVYHEDGTLERIEHAEGCDRQRQVVE